MTGLRREAPRRLRTPFTVVDSLTHERTEVVAELDPTVPTCALEAAVVAALHPRRGGLWLAGVELDGAVGGTGLRAGSVLGLGGPLAAPSTGPAVRVVAGADAGTVHRLDGQLRLGGTQLDPGPAGVAVTTSEGVTSVLRPGQALDLGDRVLSLAPPGAGSPSAPGLETVVSRPPRLRASPSVTTVQVPEEPAPVERRPLPVVPLVLPLALGVVMAVLSSPLFLLFTLLSPLMALGTWWSDRGQARRTGREQASAYAEAAAACAADVAVLRARETMARQHAAPDPGVVLATASGPGPRLWERRRADDDYLLLRVGTGEQRPSSYRLSAGAPEPLPDVPVTVPLREIGVLGITGGRGLARWLVAQAAALHSPRDLSVWLLVDPSREPSEADWGWLRWLPHARPSDAQ
ncbi:MAG: hypothetical protein ABR549_18060 [Mycobacteriales bacterium]